jgi:hypothetical protein
MKEVEELMKKMGIPESDFVPLSQKRPPSKTKLDN